MRYVMRCAVVVCLFIVLGMWGMAQTSDGVVTGTIFDPTGAVVAGATVTLKNEGTNISQSVTTETDGGFRFSTVRPGTYTLMVEATNFAKENIHGINVEASKTVPMNIKLELASAQTTVEVNSQGPLVQTATSDLAMTVNSSSIENIPLLTRNVYDLAFAAPQVTQGMNLNPASGGARESGTSYLLNGSDNNNNFSEGGVNVTPPLESVREFTILTNNMSAQYGRGEGAVVSTSQKSGTNKFHGVAYEFNRNRSLNASDFFANRNKNPKPKYIRNQFGGEIDGPVFKDKTFFAFAYDQVTLRTGQNLTQSTTATSSQVLTPSELAAITSGAGPIARSILAKFPPLTATTPCPNEPIAAVGHIACAQVFDPDNTLVRTYFGRVDHNFSSSDRLSFTANILRLSEVDLYGGGHLAVKPISGTTDQHFHQMSLVETHTFSPRVFNEFTVGHNRHYDKFIEGDGSTSTPEIVIDGNSFGFDSNHPAVGFGAYEGGLIQGFVQDRWLVQDNLGWTFGRHSFKIGGTFQPGIVYRNWDLGAPGQYEFGNTTGDAPVKNPDGTISGLDDSDPSNFQKDFPYFMETSIDPHTGAKANAYRHYIMKDSSLFAQDDWKVTPRVTVNLGLRWDRYGAPTESHGILAQFNNLGKCFDPACIAAVRVTPAPRMWNTRNRDFAPRVGFAWDIFGQGRSSLRAGYGIFYDRIFDNVWSNGAWNPPFYGLIDLDATGGDAIFYSDPAKVGAAYTPDSLPGPAGRVSVRTMENNLKDSSSQNYYLGIEQQFFQNFLFRVSYQGAMGRHLPVLMNLNRFDGIAYNKNLDLIRPNSLYTGFNYRAQNVTSNYNALVVELQKRFSYGLQFQGGYTFSKLMDYGSDLFTGETVQGSYSQPYYFVSNSHVNLEKARAGFDHTHGLKLNVVYEIPFMRSQNGFLGHVLGGWQLSTFVQAYSGHPLEIFNGRARRKGNAKDPNGFPENIGGDYNLDGIRNDHPDFVGFVNAAYSHASPADGIFKDNNPIGCGFPGAKSTNIAACNKAFGVTTPNSLFVNPAGYGVRFGNLGRNVFQGPWFVAMDAGLMKNFKITEATKLQFRAEAFNVGNHPNFDGIDSNLNSSKFGQAQILVGSAPARRFQLGLRLSF